MSKDRRVVITTLLSITVPLFIFGLLYIGLRIFTLGAGQYGEDSVDHGRFALLIIIECVLAGIIVIAGKTWWRNEHD